VEWKCCLMVIMACRAEEAWASSSRQSRDHAVNEIIARTLRSVGVPSILEPTGLIKGNGKKPDGATLVPWSGGRPMLWDFTCPDTFAPSQRQKTFLAWAAASVAVTPKRLNILHSWIRIQSTSGNRDRRCVGTGSWDIAKALERRLIEGWYAEFVFPSLNGSTFFVHSQAETHPPSTALIFPNDRPF